MDSDCEYEPAFPTASSLFSTLDGLHKKKLTWKTKSLPISVSASLESTPNDECVTIDLVDTLNTGKKCPKAGNRDDTNVYYLPPHLNENTPDFRKNVVAKHFVSACKNAGFVLWGYGYKQGERERERAEYIYGALLWWRYGCCDIMIKRLLCLLWCFCTGRM